jgi:hypothetical protein
VLRTSRWCKEKNKFVAPAVKGPTASALVVA